MIIHQVRPSHLNALRTWCSSSLLAQILFKISLRWCKWGVYLIDLCIQIHPEFTCVSYSECCAFCASCICGTEANDESILPGHSINSFSKKYHEIYHLIETILNNWRTLVVEKSLRTIRSYILITQRSPFHPPRSHPHSFLLICSSQTQMTKHLLSKKDEIFLVVLHCNRSTGHVII